MLDSTNKSHLNGVRDTSLTLDGLRVLIVDDDPDSRFLISFLLETWNFQVISASSVVEALEAIEQFQIGLLISDIAMPKIDGYTLMRKIRALEPPIGQIPAIAVTAVDAEEGRHLALMSGFQAYFVKPVEPDMLEAVISELVNIS